MAVKTGGPKVRKSFKRLKSKYADTVFQLKMLNNPELSALPKFEEKLATSDLFPLTPLQLDILQVNLGYMCNITCEHCHVDAGPDRKEVMPEEVMQQCLDAIDKGNIKTVDLTGGAPEMHPQFRWFVEEASKRGCEIIVRSNLTILVANKKYRELPDFFKKHKVVVIASLPCYTPENTDKQRGSGVFKDSIEALKMLNTLGYGKTGTELQLHLVYNPLGAHLPPPQESLEKDYKRELKKHFNIEFNNLYTITNLPISRYLEFLVNTGKLKEYMEVLVNSFNPAAAKNVMCRNTLSIGWNGQLYDCDFNQMLELPVTSDIKHIQDFSPGQLQNRKIVINQHCYGCTAGAGSSCQGTIA